MTITRKASLRFWFPTTVLLLLTIPFLSGGFRPADRASAPTLTTDSVEVAPPSAQMVQLPVGTRFNAQSGADGWSHVVLKSTPALKSGDLNTLSKEAFATARRVRLTILADVQPVSNSQNSPYRLSKVGVGLAAPVVSETPDSGDVIVAASNVGAESGDWSTKERLILAAGSRELGRATLEAATPTFALLKLPTTYLTGKTHETVDLFYAILVDPTSGELRLFVCKPGHDATSTIFREPAAPAIVDGPLHVKARTLAGIPVSWSFAMSELPQGAEREADEDLVKTLRTENLDARDPRTVEAAFRSFAERPSIARAPSVTPDD